jgi:hypothetical protein
MFGLAGTGVGEDSLQTIESLRRERVKVPFGIA